MSKYSEGTSVDGNTHDVITKRKTPRQAYNSNITTSNLLIWWGFFSEFLQIFESKCNPNRNSSVL